MVVGLGAQLVNGRADLRRRIAAAGQKLGENLFFAPLRQEVARYIFPPLTHSYALVPAALGEEVVVHGALAVAKLIQIGND